MNIDLEVNNYLLTRVHQHLYLLLAYYIL